MSDELAVYRNALAALREELAASEQRAIDLRRDYEAHHQRAFKCAVAVRELSVLLREEPPSDVLAFLAAHRDRRTVRDVPKPRRYLRRVARQPQKASRDDQEIL